jgi:hypothetical protein
MAVVAASFAVYINAVRVWEIQEKTRGGASNPQHAPPGWFFEVGEIQELVKRPFLKIGSSGFFYTKKGGFS